MLVFLHLTREFLSATFSHAMASVENLFGINQTYFNMNVGGR